MLQNTTEETYVQPLNTSYQEMLSGRTEGVELQNIEAFEGIYRQHRARVYSLCLRKTGNEAQARMMMESAFLQLFRKLDTFRGVSEFYRTYAQACARRPQVEDFIADWICRQSEQYCADEVVTQDSGLMN